MEPFRRSARGRSGDGGAYGVGSPRGASVNADLELRLWRFLAALRGRLAGSRDADQALRSALRAVAEFFEAGPACLVVLASGDDRARVRFAIPADAEWPLDLATRFLRRERPVVPRDLLLVPVERRERLWGAFVVRRESGAFDPEAHRALLPVSGTVSEILREMDAERTREVRATIDRKIMEEIRPKDLFYQILHGLRTLTGYDHSSALLMASDDDALEVAAEQIAWRKGKSLRVGLRLPVLPALRPDLLSGEARGFDRGTGAWRAWSGGGAAFAELLDYNATPGGEELREESMICAPLAARGEVLGVLKIASRHADGLGAYELGLVRRFLPQASVALQNSRRTEFLHARTIEAEKRNALANLARGVAHDVNNALGSVLPLVQQLRDDARGGPVDPAVLARDLETIETSLQACRRIFGGMLAVARGGARGSGDADLAKALGSAMALVEDGLARRGIARTVALPDRLPAIRARQTDLEQVFFNLFANARDAMPCGGTLDVRAAMLGGSVEVVVRDDGGGIPEADLPRVGEPFFTTKPQGTGLGLSICRSLLWEMGGEMKIRSRVGEGTEVRVLLPAAAAPETAKS